MAPRQTQWIESRRFLTPAGMAALYAAIGAAWILLSDRAVGLLVDPRDQSRFISLQSAKGLAYVAITTLVLFLLTRAAMGALRRSERLYRQMFESTTVALLLDPETMRVVDANEAAVAFYGWSRTELVGRHIGDINTLPLEELRIRWADVLRRDRNRLQFRHRTASGEIRDVEIFSSTIDAGRRRLLFSVVYDFTPRVEAERALEASEQRYRAAIAEASDGFLITAADDDRLVGVNARACELTAFSEAELLSMRMSDLIAPDELARIPLRTDEVAAGRTVLQERTIQRKDGGIAHVEVSAKRLEDGRVQAIVRDIGDRRRLEDQLRQAQKMEAVGQLAGGIAHDLNNVLSIVLANSELLRQGLPPERADLHADLLELQSSAQRGATMIRKLLAFSRNAPLEIVTIDLSEAIAETVGTLRHLLPTSIRIETAVAEHVLVRADAGAVEQILLNLATNARDAMPDGGILSIEVADATDPASGCLIVRDTGIGMDATTRARIFEPFFTTKPAPQGTGLGMTMIYGLVRQQQGRIEVESAPGVGTTVTICFQRAAGESPRPAAPPPATWARGTETILIVEDETALRRAATRILERLGYSVLTAANGEEALEVMRGHGERVALVLSDIVMPRMSGHALYQALREAGYTTKFLFTSGYGGGEAVAAPADASPRLIRKPWLAAELAARLREALDG